MFSRTSARCRCGRSPCSIRATRIWWHWPTRVSLGVAHLKGRVVSTGAAGSGTTVLAVRILQAAGLDPQQRHPRTEPRRRAVGRCDEGRQDRCVLLERRAADRVGPRPREHAGHPRTVHRDRRRCCRGSSRPTVRRSTTAPSFRRACTTGRTGHPGRRRRESARRLRDDAEDLAHDITQRAVRKQPELATIHPQAKTLSIEDRAQRDRRFPSIPARSATTANSRCGSVTGVPSSQRESPSLLAFALAGYALYWAVACVERTLSDHLSAAVPARSRLARIVRLTRLASSGRRRRPSTRTGPSIEAAWIALADRSRSSWPFSISTRSCTAPPRRRRSTSCSDRDDRRRARSHAPDLRMGAARHRARVSRLRLLRSAPRSHRASL